MRELAAIFLLSGSGLAGGPSFAAEFEVLDRFSVDGYTVLRGSADITSGSFAVGGSTIVVKGGNVGIGTANPGSRFEVVGGSSTLRGLDTQKNIAAFGSASGDFKVVISTSGNLDVAGGVKVGTVTANCASTIAGTLRWYDGHISVCNGEAWRQLDNQAPPTISAISPDNGPVSGGTPVTITGSGFVPGPELLINGLTATAITVVSVTQITAVTPASGTTGLKTVKLTNPDGQNIAGSFTYNPLPSFSAVDPNNGPVSGGTSITINGTGFVAGASVTIDATMVNATFINDTRLTAVTPAGSLGLKNVTVTNPDKGLLLLTGAFTYNALPVITSPLSPNNGKSAGGNAITINGSGFVSGAAVKIGGNSVTGLSISAGQITGTTPAGAIGSQAVTVTNPDGGYGELAGGFTYNPLPTVTSVSPASAPQGTVVTINGTNFGAGTGVSATFGGTAATAVTWLSSTQLRATTPSNAVSGAKAVAVTTSDTGYGELAGGFTYTAYAAGGTALGSYRVHTFNSGGSITFDTGGNVEVLVVGGGGGGSGAFSAGGGAGGMIYSASYPVAAGSYTIVVGAGGTGGKGWQTIPGMSGTDGTDSSFSTLIAKGGGSGGQFGLGPTYPSNGQAGQAGGSGGGGASCDSNTCAYGCAVAGGSNQATFANATSYGNSGGAGGGQPGYPSGGGGGAGGAGTASIASASGNGGASLLRSISGAPVYYAGGGGGAGQMSLPGTGGTGSGGAGSFNSTTVRAGDGVANTGGGGGGGGYHVGSSAQIGGNGGSGVVIIRYPVVAGLTPPTVTAVTPAFGPGGGGTPITITGTGFAAAVSVAIGNVAVAVFTRVNDTTITATTPASPNGGLNDVTVTNTADKSYGVKTGAFTYRPYATGGTITTPAGYRVHTFTSGGTLAVNTGGNIEVLVVGGGGGGSGAFSAGGGAGGLIYSASYPVPAGSYTIVVGAGGTGGVGWDNDNAMNATSGTNSSFGILIANGGGAGAQFGTGATGAYTGGQKGQDGGSGGGGAPDVDTVTTPYGFKIPGVSNQATYAYATSYGNSGGMGGCFAPYPSGGGGGAGGAGGACSGSTNGNGGASLSLSITGSAVYYAGGGGGAGQSGCGAAGTGGTGSGGAGSLNSTTVRASDGVANTGGGGGGGGYNGTTTAQIGGNGGTGVVIVRYPN